jgi:hypothetical protein
MRLASRSEDCLQQTGECRHAGEALVRERRPVEPLGRGVPVEFAVEPVIAVVARVRGDRSLGRGQVSELVTLEDLGLEGRPEGLYLAVRPGRVDLGPDVPDPQVGEAALERLSIVRTIATKGSPLSASAGQTERRAAEGARCLSRWRAAACHDRAHAKPYRSCPSFVVGASSVCEGEDGNRERAPRARR